MRITSEFLNVLMISFGVWTILFLFYWILRFTRQATDISMLGNLLDLDLEVEALIYSQMGKVPVEHGIAALRTVKRAVECAHQLDMGGVVEELLTLDLTMYEEGEQLSRTCQRVLQIIHAIES